MTMTKTCTHCQEKRPLNEFYKNIRTKDGLATWCKVCHKKWLSTYYKQNKKRINETHRRYNSTYEAKEKARARNRTPDAKKRRRIYEETHQDVIRARKKRYYENNKQRIIEKNAEYKKANIERSHAWAKAYRERHKEQIADYHRRYREKNREMLREKALSRLHNDPLHKMKERTRNMVRYALEDRGHKKTSSTKTILGCDLDLFCDYMFHTWEERYGKPWNGEAFHIDHIIPLATAKTKADVIRLCHYSNLQMLTPEDNMAKKDKLDWE